MEEQYKIKRTIWGVKGHRKPEIFLKGTYTKKEFEEIVQQKVDFFKRQDQFLYITKDNKWGFYRIAAFQSYDRRHPLDTMDYELELMPLDASEKDFCMKKLGIGF